MSCAATVILLVHRLFHRVLLVYFLQILAHGVVHLGRNLGIFYEDNASKKRWILKCDDSKTLAQIDAVFVTVGPDGGSHKPSSKPLLFAFLKPSPNHP